MKDQKRLKAIARAEKLRERISDYLEVRKTIHTGFELVEDVGVRKRRIMEELGGTEEQWNDWHWQLANRIRDVDTLTKLIDLREEDLEDITKVGKTFRWAVSPYYLSLADFSGRYGPIKLQAVPLVAELSIHGGSVDPMDEEHNSPAASVTRRYPDRLAYNTRIEYMSDLLQALSATQIDRSEGSPHRLASNRGIHQVCQG